MCRVTAAGARADLENPPGGKGDSTFCAEHPEGRAGKGACTFSALADEMRQRPAQPSPARHHGAVV